MKKIVLLCTIICCVLVGCGQTTDYNKDDGVFVGTYYPDDYWDYGEDENAKMIIMYDGEKYKIELSLTKFGDVSCIGSVEDDCLTYSGTNNDGDKFYGSIEYEKEDDVVEFELWNDDYLLFEDEDDFLEIYFKKDNQ